MMLLLSLKYFLYILLKVNLTIGQHSISPNFRSGEGRNFPVAGNQTVTSQMGSQYSAYSTTTKFRVHRVLFVGDRSSKKLRDHQTFIMLIKLYKQTFVTPKEFAEILETKLAFSERLVSEIFFHALSCFSHDNFVIL